MKIAFRFIILFSFFTSYFLTSCKNKKNNVIVSSSNDTTTIKDLTIKWNDCLVKQDTRNLATLYAEKVSIYGTTFLKSQAISNKEEFFKKYANFNQSITGDITVTKVANQQYKATFIKRSTYGGKTSDVRAYLLFGKVFNAWKIIKESDDVTDKNVANQGESQIKFKTRIEVVKEIVTTSPAFLKTTKGLSNAIIKNGGKGFGTMVEGSPNPKKDNGERYSETYDFNLHESYPDHTAVIARYSFNPSKKQLYEWDAVTDEYHPIPFDKKLLPIFDKISK